MSISQSDSRQPQSLSRPMGERGECILIAPLRPQIRIAIDNSATPNYW